MISTGGASILNSEKLGQEMAKARRRAVQLQDRASELAGTSPMLSSALAELSGALEELQAAQEFLHTQAYELQTTHARIDAERWRYHDLFMMAPDPYFITDLSAVIHESNSAATDILNMPANRLAGKPLSIYVASADKTLFFGLIQNLHHVSTALLSEFTLQPRDGEPRRIEVIVSRMIANPHLDKSEATLRWLMHDITDRKRAETELRDAHDQLSHFATRVERAREEERAHIAREMHDELGQVLTALKMDAGWLMQFLRPEALEAQTRLSQMIEQIDTAIKDVRSIATSLRPKMLDDLGLVATIEWLCKDMETRSGLHCRFVSNVDKAQMETECSSVLFRVVQEVLTNIVRHAHASQVVIRLSQSQRAVQLTIRDNGRGITPEETASRDSTGLLGMRERVHLVNGTIQIQGKAGKGTLVRARVPRKPGNKV